MLKILQFCLLMFCTAVSIGTSPNFYSWLLPHNEDARASKLSLLQGLNRPAVRLSFSLLLWPLKKTTEDHRFAGEQYKIPGKVWYYRFHYSGCPSSLPDTQTIAMRNGCIHSRVRRRGLYFSKCSKICILVTKFSPFFLQRWSSSERKRDWAKTRLKHINPPFIWLSSPSNHRAPIIHWKKENH